MTLEELRKITVNSITSCFMVEDGKVREFKIATHKEGKVISDIYTEKPESFTVGFDNPKCKKIWNPDYALPFIDVMGIGENGKLILTGYKRGGFDVPGAWFTIHGDFFLYKEDAESFLNT